MSGIVDNENNRRAGNNQHEHNSILRRSNKGQISTSTGSVFDPDNTGHTMEYPKQKSLRSGCGDSRPKQTVGQ